MKSKRNLLALGLIACFAASSFAIHKPDRTVKSQKLFTTYHCYRQNQVANLDAGGTETLGYVNIQLDAANDNIGTVATITAVDIESPSCATYTINSYSGDFIRNCGIFCSVHYWIPRNVVIHYTGTNGSGTLTLNNFSYLDGSLAC